MGDVILEARGLSYRYPDATETAEEGTGIAIQRFEDVAIHGQAVQQLVAVEEAIARLDDNTFGICPGCHRQISIDRLNVLPWAATCVACA